MFSNGFYFQDRSKRTSYYDSGGSTRLYMAKCMCLLSRIAFVSAGEQLLTALHSVFASEAQPPPLPLESYIYWILNEVYFYVNLNAVVSFAGDTCTPHSPERSFCEVSFRECKQQFSDLVDAVVYIIAGAPASSRQYIENMPGPCRYSFTKARTR